MKYPKFFPYPSSWLNALLLAGLTSTSGYVVNALYGEAFKAALETRSGGTIIVIADLALLSPTLIITFAHHWLHLLLSRHAPNLQAPEVGHVKGYFPTLFSWWEGLLGWTVMTLSLLVTLIIGIINYVTLGLGLELMQLMQREHAFIFCMGGTWLTCAAYLYHCFYLVEHRLMAVAKSDRHSRA
jgi:hypothetical protein